MWHNYIKKPEQVKAKLFEEGDQDNYVTAEDNNYPVKAPYIRGKLGRQIAEFGSHYILSDADGDRWLMTVKEFKENYESLDF